MALQEKAPDGGLWNGRKVGDWLTELIDYRVIGAGDGNIYGQ